MVTFTKFGSCVTSDVFNFMNISNYYPKHIYTGINIATAVHKADIPILEEDLVAENGFWEKMQKYCFSHEALDDCIKKWQSDYFIFDLCDERLPLQKWKCGGSTANIPVTWNTYRTSLNVLNGNSYKQYGGIEISDWHLADRNKELYRKNIQSFISSIRKYYDSLHIIYISMRQADYALNRTDMQVIPLDDFPKKGMSNFQRRKKENAVIEFAESIVREEMPDIWYINTPENLIADSEHHFGIHPLHFHYIVYEYLVKCVQGIADFDPKGFCSRRKLQVSMDVKEHWLKVKLDELISNYGKNFV